MCLHIKHGHIVHVYNIRMYMWVCKCTVPVHLVAREESRHPARSGGGWRGRLCACLQSQIIISHAQEPTYDTVAGYPEAHVRVSREAMPRHAQLPLTARFLLAFFLNGLTCGSSSPASSALASIPLAGSVARGPLPFGRLCSSSWHLLRLLCALIHDIQTSRHTQQCTQGLSCVRVMY